MKKTISLSIIATLCFILNVANAQLTLLGVGGSGVIGYTGPLDLGITGITALWSLRCSSTSYTGNVADVWDASTGSTTQTLITCSTGGVLNETVNALATTCASGCRIKTFYDQSGGLKCTGGIACNLTNPTNSGRPTLTTNCQNGKYCGVCPGTNGVWLAFPAGLTSAIVQTYMVSAVFNEANTAGSNLIGVDDQSSQFGATSAGSAYFYSGGATTASNTAAVNTWHAVQFTVNGASPDVYVDGSGAGTVNTSGANSFSAFLQIDFCQQITAGNNMFNGKFTEVSLWTGPAWSAGQKSSIDGNQRTYWAF